MNPVHGMETGRFGEWLTGLLRRHPTENIQVYYDHGDKTVHSNVAAIKAFAGEEVSNSNRLADLDVLVAKGDEALLLIEIEERPLSPKKVLGDVLAVMLCNRLAVLVDGSQRYFKFTPGTQLIIAGAVPDAGQRVSKIREVIAPRIKAISGPPGGLRPDRVGLLFSRSLADTIQALKETTETIVSGIT